MAVCGTQMPVGAATIEHMFDKTRVPQLAQDDAIARIDALREADTRWKQAEADRARLVVDTVLAVSRAAPADEERVIRSGAGTPLIAEFAHLEVAAALGCSPHVALNLISDLLDMRFRMPRLWQRILDLDVPVWKARAITMRTTSLSLDVCREVDRRIGNIGTWSKERTIEHINELIAEVDTERIERCFDLKKSHRRVVFDRESSTDLVYLDATLSVTDAQLLEGTVNALARTLVSEHPDESLDERKSRALGILATPAYALAPLEGATGKALDRTRPPATLHLHINAASPRLVHGDRCGTIPAQALSDLLARCHVTVRPVLDLNSNHAVDRHDPPPLMRHAMHIREPVEVFPYSTMRSSACDLDHTVPYDPHGPKGQTCLGNLGPLSRTVHRAKTHSRWHLDQHRPGIYEWTSPLGYRYSVTHGKTRYRGHRRPQRE